ncbi:MAG TPA: PilZ domain-containing protein [Candidatus Nitrosotenuis sp.]|jgi:hypothetical protein|nr:PilZ domain-containing protein [Candidatus Nitrosotenuis sp.]
MLGTLRERMRQAFCRLRGDRRRAPRYPAAETALVRLEGQTVEGRLVDFSETGLRFAADRPLPLGRRGRLAVAFEGCVLRREFRVVRASGNTLAAVLTEADPSALVATLTFLHRLRQRARFH